MYLRCGIDESRLLDIHREDIDDQDRQFCALKSRLQELRVFERAFLHRNLARGREGGRGGIASDDRDVYAGIALENRFERCRSNFAAGL